MSIYIPFFQSDSDDSEDDDDDDDGSSDSNSSFDDDEEEESNDQPAAHDEVDGERPNRHKHGKNKKRSQPKSRWQPASYTYREELEKLMKDELAMPEYHRQLILSII